MNERAQRPTIPTSELAPPRLQEPSALWLSARYLRPLRTAASVLAVPRYSIAFASNPPARSWSVKPVPDSVLSFPPDGFAVGLAAGLAAGFAAGFFCAWTRLAGSAAAPSAQRAQ